MVAANFSDFTQRRILVSGQHISPIFLDSLILEDGPGANSRNVIKRLPLHDAQNSKKGKVSVTYWEETP